jgi:cyclopropane fatty-acyl-phospholipid synthase-like methyltransferase
MKDQDPVASDAYNERWLTSAWGSNANDRLLSDSDLRPRPRLQRALDLAQLAPGQVLLDIACGRGELPIIANQSGVRAIGIDFSSTALAFAQKLKASRTGSAAVEDIQFVRADACHLPFASDSFDRITLLDIIEHLVPSQLEMMLREVHRLLKPNGYAVLHTLPNRWVYDIAFPVMHRIFPKFSRNPRSEFEKEIHVNEQDLPSLHHMLVDCGFKHRLWLEQHMPSQARWNHLNDKYNDQRDRLYPMLAGPMGTALEWLSRTPLKLVLSNDIFGVAWKQTPPQGLKLPLGLTERLACRLLPGKQQPHRGG